MSEDNNSETLPGFTKREMYLLAGGLLCLKSGDIAVAYVKLAEFGKFKNANSAKASWNTIKKKLDKIAGSGAVTPSGNKRKADDAADGDESPVPSPKKKKGGKKPAAKAEATVKEECSVKEENVVKSEDEDGDF